VSVLTLGELLRLILGLDQESVSTEVITLSLKKVGGQVLGAVTIEERKSSAESGCRDASLDRPSNDISPTLLSVVDGLVEEVIEEQVLEVRVLAVSRSDVLEEDRTNNATAAPHESDGGLVQLPAVLLGSLNLVNITILIVQEVDSQSA
jgi:hypothetical protein